MHDMHAYGEIRVMEYLLSTTFEIRMTQGLPTDLSNLKDLNFP